MGKDHACYTERKHVVTMAEELQGVVNVVRKVGSGHFFKAF